MPAFAAARAAPHRVLASSSRVEILHLLQRADTALGVDDLAALTGRHVNTTREHLERLRLAGYVERTTERRRTRGRPRVLYSAVDRAGGAGLDERLREHLLRSALEGYGVDLGDARAAAEEVGRAFVRENPDAHHRAVEPSVDAAEPGDAVGEDPTGQRLQAVRQLAALEAHLVEMRMSPEVDLPAWQVHLRSCPFLDLARRRTEIVCSVHLGVLRGVLEKEGGPVSAERLVPFVAPGQCRVDLSVEGTTTAGATLPGCG